MKQVKKDSIAMALKEAHHQTSKVIVISGSVMSTQGEEIMETTKFAKLLRDLLLSGMVGEDTTHFTCIFIAVQSET